MCLCVSVGVLKGQARRGKMKERKSCGIEKQAAQHSFTVPSYKFKSLSQAAKNN